MTMMKRTFKVWDVETPEDFTESIFGKQSKTWTIRTMMDEDLEPGELKENLRLKIQEILGTPVKDLQLEEIGMENSENRENQ